MKFLEAFKNRAIDIISIYIDNLASCCGDRVFIPHINNKLTIAADLLNDIFNSNNIFIIKKKISACEINSLKNELQKELNNSFALRYRVSKIPNLSPIPENY